VATGDPGPLLGEVGFIQVLLAPGWAKVAICSLLFSFAGGNHQILLKLGYQITPAQKTARHSPLSWEVLDSCTVKQLIFTMLLGIETPIQCFYIVILLTLVCGF